MIAVKQAVADREKTGGKIDRAIFSKAWPARASIRPV
jgi:hypothetical protein